MKEFKLLGYTFNKKEQETWAKLAEKAVVTSNKEDIKASFYGESYEIEETIFDGEKTPGELGAPLKYLPDYNALSYRSHQAVAESDIAQIIIKTSVNWVIGAGLKFQCEPIQSVIEKEGFNFDRDDFVKTTEERFRLFVKTRSSVHSEMMNYQKLQRIAYYNAIVSGDVLIIDRFKNGLPNRQLIDGIHVQTPNDPELIEKIKNKGNQIVHGVEFDKTGKHLRFYVAKNNPIEDVYDVKKQYTIIEAYGKNSKKLQAFLLYGSDNRIDSVRGMPLLSAVLQKISQIDDYNESIVSGTKSRSKIAYIFEHNQHSDGTNPDLARLANAVGDPDAQTAPAGTVISMTDQSRAVKREFGEDAYNMPVGATMKALVSSMELNQEAFVTGNFIYICAACETPYEIALIKFVNSFSSSKMAVQTYLTLLKIKRNSFNDDFNKLFYNLFLDTQILQGKITADGYFSAMIKNDVILTAAYQNCRFTGSGVPQARPIEEVKAEILKNENLYASREESIEVLGGSEDFPTTINKLAKEKELIDEKLPEEEVETEEVENTKETD